MKKQGNAIGKLLGLIFGDISWNAPPWLTTVKRTRKENPKKFWIGVLLVALLSAGIGVGYVYYQSLPKPIMIIASIEEPGITPNVKDPKPDSLRINFEYDLGSLKPGREAPSGEPSVARIDLVGKEVKTGISLSPDLPGEWRWEGDRTLVFSPGQEWLAGTEYTVKFDKSIFVEEALFPRLSYEFVTPAFAISLSDLEFYQDPKDKTVRKVVSTLTFTHPVEKKSLEEHLLLTMRPSGASITDQPEKYSFTVEYDKNQREAYVHSVPVSLPEKPNYMKLVVSKGVVPVTGGTATEQEISKQILIPDIYSFLKIQKATTQIVRNEKQEPEQLLILEFTDDISEEELLSKLTAYVLPKRNNKRGSDYWSSPREVTKDVLENSDGLELKLIPNEHRFSKAYNFIYDAPPERYIYLHIKSGLTSINKFVKSSLYDNILPVPRYPKEAKIMGDGSMLSLSGKHQLSMLVRGLEAVKVKLGKLLPGQVNHLVSQTSGDLKDPYFENYRFNKNNIVEYEQEIIQLKPKHPKEANYLSIDLSSHLPSDTTRFGLFFIDVKGWDMKNKRELMEANDKRLVLVTDLGLLVKNNADQSHDFFVQSINKGKPVSGARVELLGRNGVPLFTRITDVDGHAMFPSTKGFGDEQQPNVYIVRTTNDTSFIPFERSSRRMNYSHFDVGGIREQHQNRDNLNAFLFTDRGIYRPGEEIQIGVIVKNRDLSNVEGIPLEIVISGPRGNEGSVKKLTLPEKGFFDHQYKTDPTSDTGAYQVFLYLVRDNKYRDRMIGSASFRVEEFQPDTLKIQSKFLGMKDKGWTSEALLKARVKLENMFGTPAQGRKVTGHLSVRATNFSFKEYKDYTFADPYYDPKKQHMKLDEMLESQQTDQDGLAHFEIPLERFDQGTYQLTLTTEGFEPGGGRSVWAQNGILLSPLAALVGYKSDGKLDYINMNSERYVDLLAVGFDLKQQAMKDLRARLVLVQNISSLVKQRNGTYKYQTVKREKKLHEEEFEIGADGYKYRLPTDKPGDFVLEVLDSADLRLARVRFNVVGHGNLLGNLEKNAELSLKLNKNDYKAGERVEMNITAPYKGSGLITIERDRVHTYKWFSATTNSTIETIRIPDHLEGNAYVNVAFVRDAGSKEIYSSPLSYAVMPFTIDRSKRELDVELGVDPIVRPGKKMEIRYSASAPSRIVVFAVDEGILQVAKYKPPDPLSHFLQKRALEVETLQIMDLILPEFDLVKEVSASGGGMAEMARKAIAKNLNPFARKVDKPAVFWSGILDADNSERVVSFVVPDTFAGNLRVMAVAVADEAMGISRESTLVRGPFVITPSVLTQAAPGDQFKVSIGVANIIEGSGKEALVEVRVEASEHLEIVGQNKTLLKIDEDGEKTADFELKVKDRLGAAELKFFATFKDEEGYRSASLSVRPVMPYYSSMVSGYDKAGPAELEIARLLYNELAEQKISASGSPLVLVEGLSSYLKHFPHGCTEQVVSQVFPIIGLMTHPAFQPYSKDNKARFDHLITKLRERQLPNGGFCFWPGGSEVAEFPTVYVMHFLVESQELGYAVPDNLMTRGRDYLRSYVGGDAGNMEEARVRAYAIYLLTRMGEVTTNYLVHLQTYLEENHKKIWKKDLTASYMAASYKLLQKETEADELIGHYRVGTQEQETYSDFHSPLTLDAQYIFLLSRHFEKRVAGIDGNEIIRLVEPIFRGRYNTISSAYTILALGAYSRQRLNTHLAEKVKFSEINAEGLKKELESQNVPFATAHFNINSSKVFVTADQPVFYLASQSGFDHQPPQKAVREKLEITREYLDKEGNEVTKLEQGMEVTVRLRIRALGEEYVSNVAVVDLLPGGFEVIRSSVPRTAYNWRADYVDIREDRVVFYGGFGSSAKELTYRAKLTAAGKFTIPPAFAESMYDRAVRASSLAGQFEVVPSK